MLHKVQFEQRPIASLGEYVQAQLLPPDIPARPGRKKKRVRVAAPAEPLKPRRCHSCGDTGHYSKSCPSPNVREMIKHVNISKYGGLDIKELVGDLPAEFFVEDGDDMDFSASNDSSDGQNDE